MMVVLMIVAGDLPLASGGPVPVVIGCGRVRCRGQVGLAMQCMQCMRSLKHAGGRKPVIERMQRLSIIKITDFRWGHRGKLRIHCIHCIASPVSGGRLPSSAKPAATRFRALVRAWVKTGYPARSRAARAEVVQVARLARVARIQTGTCRTFLRSVHLRPTSRKAR
jgi:hypothetical protein